MRALALLLLVSLSSCGDAQIKSAGDPSGQFNPKTPGVYVLCKSAVAVAVTGTLTETAMFTCRLPVLTATSVLRITSTYQHAGFDAGLVYYRIGAAFPGTTVAFDAFGAGGTDTDHNTAAMIVNLATANSQQNSFRIVVNDAAGADPNLSGNYTLTAINTALSGLDLTISCQLVNITNSCNLDYALVELL